MAHAIPLVRTNTAPVFQSNSNTIAGVNSMNHAPRVSQLSGSTALNSTTSLNSLSSVTTPQNGNVVATSNIINQKADASRSLYQRCILLKQRLAQVPDFEENINQLDQSIENNGADPVESIWNLFRKGYPLLTIYNSLQPEEPLKVDDPNANEARKVKLSIFRFIKACNENLKIPAAECFVINELLGNDTTGFVKVTQVVNYVLDLAEQRGLLLQVQQYPEENAPTTGGSKMTYRDHIVKELVDTERKYVQDLENLHDLKKALEQKGVIPGDIVHQIFLNINAILDFQRRFLIRVEQTNSQPSARQQWGAPFVTYEEAFSIYLNFIANQRKAAQIANQVFDKIKLAEHPVAFDFNTLDGFLLKPMQRLVKYPLLLKDLLKKSDDEATKADLAAGIESAERVLQKANEAVDRDLLDEALEDLINRVDDWKNHRVEQFGKLLLHGVYTVVTGKSEQEKDYEIYLFECILLCCKEVSANKSKDKKDKTKSTGPKVRNRNAKLQLKGRIFMTNVTEVLSFAKTGSYTVQIWWKGDPGVENFVIKFTNEEMMKKWATGLDAQRKDNAPQSTTTPDMPPNFAWMQSASLENPYAQQDEDEEEDPTPVTTPYGMTTQSTGGTMVRNASSSNLQRMRSETGGSQLSLASMVRAPPPRFPLPPTPLSIQTQVQPQPMPSPNQRGGESYFSPVGESPASSRTSTTSGMFPQSAGYPFPKSGTPQGWEDNQRYTAPAMPRAPSRDGPSPSPANAYGMVNGRNPRGPSLPAMASNSQAFAQGQRNRAYSTPDINGPAPQQQRRQNSQSQIPAVPGIPSHLHPAHDANIPRSQSGSPANGLPIRTNTQSPGMGHRHHASGSYGGSMAQFPSQPVHSRQNTPVPTSTTPTPDDRTMSPQLSSGQLGSGSQSNPLASPEFPTQVKVKVHVDKGNYITLVAAFNITYQSLIDRIDAKLNRFTSSSIGKGNLKLRYQDEDGDFVTIGSDEDIQIAFSEWNDGVKNMYPGSVGEIDLYCIGDVS